MRLSIIIDSIACIKKWKKRKKLCPNPQTGDQNDRNRNYCFGCEFYSPSIHAWIMFNSFWLERFHYSASLHAMATLFAMLAEHECVTKVAIERQNRNELQKWRLRMKSQMCFRLRINRSCALCAYISGIQSDRFFRTRNVVGCIGVIAGLLAVTILPFYLSVANLLCFSTTKCIVVPFVRQVTIEWLTSCQPIYVIFFPEQKSANRGCLPQLNLLFDFDIQTPYKSQTLSIVALFVGCILYDLLKSRTQFDNTFKIDLKRLH